DDGGGQYTLPTSSQEQQILATWAAVVPTPVFDYAYSWGSQSSDQALEGSTPLQAVFAAHNGMPPVPATTTTTLRPTTTTVTLPRITTTTTAPATTSTTTTRPATTSTTKSSSTTTTRAAATTTTTSRTVTTTT